jgi:hypothetical protein
MDIAAPRARSAGFHIEHIVGMPIIIAPYTGSPPSGVLSVTVVGPDLATADAYAAAAFAMGAADPAWTSRLLGYFSAGRGT